MPGHGFLPDDPAMTRAGLQGHRQILLDVREAVERQIAQGATEDEAVAAIDLPQYRRFQGYSRAMEMAVRRTCLELVSTRLVPASVSCRRDQLPQSWPSRT